MAPTAQIGIETYLKTSYRPDCDFVDGEIEERNLGEFDHAQLQAAVSAWFYAHRKDWNIHVLPNSASACRIRGFGSRMSALSRVSCPLNR